MCHARPACPAPSPRSTATARTATLGAGTVVALLAGALAPDATAASYPVTVTWSVNGAAPLSATTTLVPSPTGGSPINTHEAELDGVLFAWNYVTELDPEGGVVINGATTLTNSSATTVQVHADISAIVCPALLANVKFGGVASVQLNADGEGGAVSSIPCVLCDTGGGEELPPGEVDCTPCTTVAAVTLDGSDALAVFPALFQLNSGGGSIQTTKVFGSPFPSLPGPAPTSTVGHRISLLLTPGDKAKLVLFLLVKGDFVPPPSCPADVNGDGVVDGGDLGLVMGAIGIDAPCGEPTDVNCDGVVDSGDMGAILAAWGACPLA